MVNDPRIRPETQRIWLIDRRRHWREKMLHALLAAGFHARAWASYEYPPTDPPPGGYPDLVIVNATRFAKEEEALVQRILKLGHPLLVVSGRVPVPMMRAIFRAGARDVVESPPNGEKMISLVEQSLQQGMPVSSYEAVAREGRSRL